MPGLWSKVRKINEEEKPTICYLVFYFTSSGAHDYVPDYHMDRLILRLLMVGG
jgi:hypothetical protein